MNNDDDNYADRKDIVAFHEVEFEIIDKDWKRWLRANSLAPALGCKPRSLRKLIGDMVKRGELKGGKHFLFLPLPSPGGVQETMILSREGVIRVAMRSDGDRAIEFRDFAETVLVEVMTIGRYEDPRLPKRFETQPTELIQAFMVLIDIIRNAIEQRNTEDHTPAIYDPYHPLNKTPCQLLKAAMGIPDHKNVFSGFNSGNRFNWWVGGLWWADHHHKVTLPQRPRLTVNKNGKGREPEYYIMDTAPNRRKILRAYEDYKDYEHNRPRQPNLFRGGPICQT
jgi:prophage antirepressor-like protein